MERERVLFIGTQFSILYTSMYSPAEAASVPGTCTIPVLNKINKGMTSMIMIMIIDDPPVFDTVRIKEIIARQ